MLTKAQKALVGLGVAAVAGLFLLGILVGAAVSGWRAAVRAGNEAACLQNIKTIAAVEVQYFNLHKRTFGTFDELIKEKMLSTKFEGKPVIADGYVFDLSVNRGSQSMYRINTDPENGAPGRHFYLDSSS